MLFVASSARMIATWSTASYLAIYFHRQFPSQVSLFSVYNAIFVSIGGVASSWGGGAIADRLRVYNEGVLGYLPAVGSLGAIFPMAVVLFSPKFSVALSGLFFAYLVGECWLGPGMALLQMELPKELTGTSVAILLFLNSVVCNIGPWFITWQDDGLATVNRPLFAVLFVSFLSSFFLFSAVGFIVSRKHQRRRSILMSIEAAGVLDTEGDTGKPFDVYTRQSRDSSNNVRRGKSPNLCEMVRRTFSSETRLETAVFQGDEEDMRVSSALSRRESTSGVGRNRVSCAVEEPGTGMGERDSLLRGSSSGMI